MSATEGPPVPERPGTTGTVPEFRKRARRPATTAAVVGPPGPRDGRRAGRGATGAGHHARSSTTEGAPGEGARAHTDTSTRTEPRGNL
ncbi:hypothetical protein ACIQCR_23690 [Streptomyces sp. NPDC093249]|uniref:hypothetical protein n=1 Tax=Streptomyces sp. NPDC093249 TaxID=3366035 RepID=UPI00380F85A1